MAYTTTACHQEYWKTNTTQDDDGRVNIWVRQEHASMAFSLDEARTVLRDLKAAIKHGEQLEAKNTEAA